MSKKFHITEGPHTHTPYSNNQDLHQLDIPIFAKLYEFYSHLNQILVSFPKIKRYTLGERIDNLTLDIFELLFSVTYSNDKLVILQKISSKLDLLKILIRLSKDSQAMNHNQYIKLQSYLQEIGRMLGGWIRATKNSS